MPWPPQRVESPYSALGTQLSMSCQLLLTQTFRARIDVDVNLQPQAATYVAERRRNRVAGLHAWRRFSVRAPHRCANWPEGPAKLEIQTLSSPSTATALRYGKVPACKRRAGISCIIWT